MGFFFFSGVIPTIFIMSFSQCENKLIFLMSIDRDPQNDFQHCSDCHSHDGPFCVPLTGIRDAQRAVTIVSRCL